MLNFEIGPIGFILQNGSLSAIYDLVPENYFHKMANLKKYLQNVGCRLCRMPENCFDRISRYFRSIRNFFF